MNSGKRPSFLSSGAGQHRFRRSSQHGGIPSYIWLGVGGTTALFGYCYFAFLDKAPLTERKRWIAISPELESELGDQEYKQLLQQFRRDILPPTHRAAVTVKRVGSRIAAAQHEFATSNDLKIYSSAPYTYTVIRSDMANAFVLPGNHVFVMTGLFKYVKDEDELAAVLGHEAAHNLARHAGERVSGSFVTNIMARISLLIDPTGILFTLLVPAAKLFAELPNSRDQETEADQIGVHLAAIACYDPRAAKRVFAAMKDGQEGGVAPPEFLSTHPSHDSRISNFDEWMPAAMQTYESDFGERCRQVRHDMALARKAAAQQAAMRESNGQQQRWEG